MLSDSNFNTKHVGDIVAENYHAAGVFREYGIDFCCGGGRPLQEVCQQKGVNLDEISAKLSSLSNQKEDQSNNYNEWSPTFLIDYIVNTHHNFVRKKTNEIPVYAAKVAKVHGERHPENIEIFKTFVSLANELLEHLESEENTVFPLIKQIAMKKEAGEPVPESEILELKTQLSCMEEEHEGAGKLMAEINMLSHRYTPPQDACATYQILYQNLEGFEKDLHKHVHLENNILFQKAEKLIAG